MEDAERVMAVCSATPTALDCTGDLVANLRASMLRVQSSLREKS